MVLAGGTVADVYTGTWIEANVEVEDGRITYVGPREPSGDVIDVRGQGAGAGLHRAAHAPVVPVLAVVAARGRGARRDDDARLRQPLLLPLARGRRAAQIVDRHERRARAHLLGGAARAADGVSRTTGSRSMSSRRCSRGPRSWRAARSRTGARRRGGSSRRASPPRRRRGGGSRATTRARPTTGSRSCRWPGISSDHEAITGQEALNRLRLGMWTMLRNSSLRPDLEHMLRDLAPVIDVEPPADAHHRRRRAELLCRGRHDRRRAADRDRAGRRPDARAADGDDRSGDVPAARRGAGRDRARPPRDAQRPAGDRRVAARARVRRRARGRARRAGSPCRRRRSTGPPARSSSRRRRTRSRR